MKKFALSLALLGLVVGVALAWPRGTDWTSMPDGTYDLEVDNGDGTWSATDYEWVLESWAIEEYPGGPTNIVRKYTMRKKSDGAVVESGTVYVWWDAAWGEFFKTDPDIPYAPGGWVRIGGPWVGGPSDGCYWYTWKKNAATEPVVHRLRKR